jgi:hypothetical protein
MFGSFLRFVAGVLVAAAALEGLGRLLPVSTATRTGYAHDALVRTYPANHAFTLSTGWDLRNPQRLRVNQAGFVADRAFVPDARAVALIGDSHVEASALSAGERPGAQLQRALGAERPVYALGTPGTSLLDFAESIRHASEQFGVGDVVVLLTEGDVRQSVCGSGQIAGPCVHATTGLPGVERDEQPTLSKRMLRNSALAQYLFSQLKVTPAGLWPALRALPAALLPGSRSPDPLPVRSLAPPAIDVALEQRVAALFFERIRPYVRARLVFVLLHGHQAEPHSASDILRFAAIARRQGATVVDLAPVYAAHRAGSPLSLAIGPYDAHHNPLGVALAAEQVAGALRGAPAWPGRAAH